MIKHHVAAQNSVYIHYAAELAVAAELRLITIRSVMLFTTKQHSCP